MESFPTHILPDNTGVEIDGDIVSLADAGIDPDEIENEVLEDPDPSDLLDMAMAKDFSARNETLVDLSRRISRRNNLHGQLQLTLDGRLHYNTAGELEDLRDAQNRRIGILSEEACGRCALIDFCTIGPEVIATRLDEDAKMRARFRKRVEHPENNKLCATNMQPGRLSS